MRLPRCLEHPLKSLTELEEAIDEIREDLKTDNQGTRQLLYAMSYELRETLGSLNQKVGQLAEHDATGKHLKAQEKMNSLLGELQTICDEEAQEQARTNKEHYGILFDSPRQHRSPTAILEEEELSSLDAKVASPAKALPNLGKAEEKKEKQASLVAQPKADQPKPTKPEVPPKPKAVEPKTVEPKIAVPKAAEQKVSDNKSALFTPPVAVEEKKQVLALSKKDQEVLEQLLTHVVRGEQDKAEKLVKANSQLLLHKAQITDYSGREIDGTAFQLALGAEDVEMCKMLTPYFKELPDGEIERLRQYQEQFPADEEKEADARAKDDLQALNKVVKAIGDSKDDKDCEKALEAFREYLRPKATITRGKHFNVQLLIEAFKLYDEKYNDFGKDNPNDEYNSRKNILFWRKVIGYIERYLPACYAQSFCQGVYYIVEKGEKLNRSLEFRNDKGVLFYPLDSNSSSRLGLDHASSGERGGWGSAQYIGWRGQFFLAHFYKLCRAKKSGLVGLMQRPTYPAP